MVIGHFALDSAHASLVLFIAIGDTVCQQLTSTVGQVFQTYEKLRVMATLTVSVNILRFALALGLFIAIGHANAYLWAFASMLVSILAAVFHHRGFDRLWAAHLQLSHRLCERQ